VALYSALLTWSGTIIVSRGVTSIFLTFLFAPLLSLHRQKLADSLVFLWDKMCAAATSVDRLVIKGVGKLVTSKFGGMLAQSGTRGITLLRFADF